MGLVLMGFTVLHSTERETINKSTDKQTISDDRYNAENKALHLWICLCRPRRKGPCVFLCLTPFEFIASKAVRSTAGKLSSESNISLSSSWNLSSWNSTHFSWSSPLGPVWTGLIYFSPDSPSCICAQWWCSHGAFSLPVSTPQSFPLPLLSVSAYLASAPAHRHSSERVMSRYEVTLLMIRAIISPFLILYFSTLKFVFTLFSSSIILWPPLNWISSELSQLQMLTSLSIFCTFVFFCLFVFVF